MIALTVDYYDIKRENEQNVKYLELKEQKKDYQFALASVIGRDPGGSVLRLYHRSGLLVRN